MTANARDGWGLQASTIEYLPVGFGSYHWRLVTDKGLWFVTADDLRARTWHRGEAPNEGPLHRLRAALSTARGLADAGLSCVVAPTETRSGDVVHVAAGYFAIALYPYVEGTTPDMDVYMSHADRIEVLDLIMQVHRFGARLADTALVDDFAVQRRDDLTDALGDDTPTWDTGPYGEPAHRLLDRHSDAIEHALGRYDELVDAARQRPERLVLTHGEPHPRNTLRSAHGLKLIDWDTALRAPPERDMWMLTDGDASIVDAYAASTGTPLLDDTLSLYRLRWDLTEVAIYIGLFRRPHTSTADTSIAWGGLNGYLDPRRWSVD